MPHPRYDAVTAAPFVQRDTEAHVLIPDQSQRLLLEQPSERRQGQQQQRPLPVPMQAHSGVTPDRPAKHLQSLAGGASPSSGAGIDHRTGTTTSTLSQTCTSLHESGIISFGDIDSDIEAEADALLNFVDGLEDAEKSDDD